MGAATMRSLSPLPVPRRAALRAAAAAPLASPARGQPAAGEWRVGAIFPLASLLGDEAMRGVEMAAEERNAQGGLAGRPIRLLRAVAADAAQALAEARRLLGADRCALLVGSVSAPVALAAAQAADAEGAPFIELAAAAEALLDRGFRQLVRLSPAANDFATVARDAIARAVAPALSMPADSLRVAILHEASPSPESLAAALEARLREAGVPVAERLGHAPRSAELPAMVERLRAAGVSAVAHAGGEADIAALLRAMQDAGWRPPLLLGLGAAWGLADLARAAGPWLDGALVVDAPPVAVAEGFAHGARGFAEAYQRRWGAPPRASVSLASFALMRAVFSAPALERASFRAWLAQLDLAEGALANGWGLRLDGRGQNGRARPVAAQWQNQRPCAVFPPEAAVAAFRA